MTPISCDCTEQDVAYRITGVCAPTPQDGVYLGEGDFVLAGQMFGAALSRHQHFPILS